MILNIQLFLLYLSGVILSIGFIKLNNELIDRGLAYKYVESLKSYYFIFKIYYRYAKEEKNN